VAAVGLLGRTDGILGNPKARIPLPRHRNSAARFLRATGQGKRVDDSVTLMNRAAEAAVAESRELLVSSVRQVSGEDSLKLVRGGDTAVTDFFARRTRAPRLRSSCRS
jgi:hypothetical protein